MKLSELPEMRFADLDAEKLSMEVVESVEGLLGRTLERADPLRLFLRGIESIILQQRILIDELAKQNLLAYATGENLEHLGILVGVERLQAERATATVEVSLSGARTQTTVIKRGTRVNAGDDVNFGLDEDLIFLSGEVVKVGKVTCIEAGEVGNGYAIGELNKIVDPQPFLKSIENITASEGGSDIESDDAFRERIQVAPESFSVAGPAGAYEFFTKSVSSQINDVYVESESPGEVTVWALLKDGELPDSEMQGKILAALSADNVRPLTDLVQVKAPEVASYDIELRYWINRSESTSSLSIQAAAAEAVSSYEKWQRAVLGRDINPTELYYRLRSAGVKRVEIITPQFRKVAKNAVARANEISVVYAGLEDD